MCGDGGREGGLVGHNLVQSDYPSRRDKGRLQCAAKWDLCLKSCPGAVSRCKLQEKRLGLLKSLSAKAGEPETAFIIKQTDRKQ